MPKRLPITDAKALAKKHSLRQVILLAWDGERTHVVTYGSTQEDCAQAAAGGNKVKAALGWPESLQAEPAVVQRLKARVAELERSKAEILAAVTRRTRAAYKRGHNAGFDEGICK